MVSNPAAESDINQSRVTYRSRAGARRSRFGRLGLEPLEQRRLLAFSVLDAAVTLPPTSADTLVPFETVWRYRDDGSDQGLAWRESAFDDSSWPVGRELLGFVPIVDIVKLGGRVNCGPSAPRCDTDNFATTYFRHSFTAASPEGVSGLTATIWRNQAAAVYLNGVEVYRDVQLPIDSAFDTFSTEPLEGTETSTFLVDPKLLRDTENVLAVEIHLASPTDQEMFFALGMTAVEDNSDDDSLRIEVQFDEAVDPASLDAGDLSVDGRGATGVTMIDSRTAVFGLPELMGPEPLTVSIPAGAVWQAGAPMSHNEAFEISFGLDVAAQYLVKHTPRLQPGDAVLSPFSGSETDRVDVLWETMGIGEGTDDWFRVEFRPAGSDNSWMPALLNDATDTQFGDRLIHSATIDGLAYDAEFEYRVRHGRADLVVNTYQDTFRTRLPAGSEKPFTFAAYGDSARLKFINNFRSVQRRILQSPSAFAFTLGDNIYPLGRHPESDVRFDPSLSPEVADWIASHIDYAAIGNHELSVTDGQPYRDLFSSPIPRAGFSAHVQPPDSEPPEHNYSFDYGNVHFLTFDTNSLHDDARLDALLDWAVADFAASGATWKIVFAHHPVAFVPDKPESPSDHYYQQVVSRLRDANVDVFLVGHSHSFSWTKPLLGHVDRVATFVDDTDKQYEKGAGLVQVVTGVGGRELRVGSYSEPGQEAVAAGFTSETTPASRFGFAQFDVSPTHLKVSYVAADDGEIIDSFSIVSPEPAGLSATITGTAPSSGLDAVDAVAVTFSEAVVGFDLSDVQLTRDGVTISLPASVSLATTDRTRWSLGNLEPLTEQPGQYQLTLKARGSGIIDLAGNRLLQDTVVTWSNGRQSGDVNLDRLFDQRDIVEVLQAGGEKYLTARPARWSEGDWNADGVFNQLDIVAALATGNYLQGPYASSGIRQAQCPGNSP